MESRGGRRHRPAAPREHRLIPFAIGVAIAALDVRRQRHVSNRVDRRLERRAILGPETNDSASVELLLEHLAVDRVNSFKRDPRSLVQFLPRMHQSFPEFGKRVPRISGSQSSHQEALHGAARRHAVSEQARGKHARVVDDDEVARAQEVGQRTDCGMRDGSAVAAKVQQPRSRAIGGWFLCD